MKKFLTSVILLISAVILCTAVAGAETYVDYGDYQYKIKRDGTIKITDYRGSTTELEIPAEFDGMKVTEVDGFYDCKTLVSVIIPYGVKKIGISAFNGCTSLENISIPDSVTVIGNDAFIDCISLRTIRLPESLQSIESYAFQGCRLESVYIPDINLNIEDDAFSRGAYFICGRRSAAERYAKVYGLSYEYFSGEKPDNRVSQEMGGYRYEILADNTVSVIGYLGKDERVIVPEKMNGMMVVKIEDNAFSGTSVKSVTIPDSVQSIGRAFSDCDKLEELILPESLTKLYAYAFEGCTSLKKIRLPKNLSASEIGIVDINDTIFNPFENCTSLEVIEVDEENKELYSIDGVLFSMEDNRLMFYPAGKTDSVYEIPEGTKIIGDLSRDGRSVFADNYYLEAITVPESVIHIGRYAFSNIENKLCVEFVGEGHDINLSDFTFANSPRLFIKCLGNSVIHKYAAMNEVKFELYGGFSPDSGSVHVTGVIIIAIIPVLLIIVAVVLVIVLIKKQNKIK